MALRKTLLKGVMPISPQDKKPAKTTKAYVSRKTVYALITFRRGAVGKPRFFS